MSENDYDPWEDEWMFGEDADTMPRLNVIDRVCFHPDLSVKMLRMICRVHGIDVRQKASRDEVALIMRREGIAAPTDTGFGKRLVTVWADDVIADARRLAALEPVRR